MKYYVVDAFTESAFKGNPAAVCLLEEERDDEWLQALAAEFNISMTSYLIPIQQETKIPRFHLRWFSPIVEDNLCGHATLAAAHVAFSSGLVDRDVIEFMTQSGMLTAKKISSINGSTSGMKNFQNHEAKDVFYVELDFPADPISELKFDDISLISGVLSEASIVDVKRTEIQDDLIVMVASAKNVTEVQPHFDAIYKLPVRGVSVSGVAPPESGFDF